MSYKSLFAFPGIILCAVLSLGAQAQNTLSNDSANIEYKKVVADLESLERGLLCTVQKYPFGFDETTGLKMVYILTNGTYNVSKGVDNIILTNNRNELVFVVKAVMRHDRGNMDEDSLYGLYVVGKDTEGEIEISSSTFFDLKWFLFQMGKSPEFVNCSDIKFRVAAKPNLIPFSPVNEENRVKYQRFFGSVKY